jgi:hypothetical protein
MELPPEVLDAFLLLEAKERPQAQFHCFAFGFETCDAEDLANQFIVDFDVGSHGRHPADGWVYQ